MRYIDIYKCRNCKLNRLQLIFFFNYNVLSLINVFIIGLVLISMMEFIFNNGRNLCQPLHLQRDDALRSQHVSWCRCCTIGRASVAKVHQCTIQSVLIWPAHVQTEWWRADGVPNLWIIPAGIICFKGMHVSTLIFSISSLPPPKQSSSSIILSSRIFPTLKTNRSNSRYHLRNTHRPR